jgi:hypothetical protein
MGMVGKGPIQTQNGSPAVPMSRGHYLAMALHQGLAIPAPRLEHRRMHRATLNAFPLGPHPLGMNPLQRLIGAQQQPRQITAHLGKASSATKHRTIRLQVLLQRWRKADHGEHCGVSILDSY